MTRTQEATTMNESFDAARLHREELDREIDSLRMERLIRSTSHERPGLPARARASLGHGLISIGTLLVGKAGAAADVANARPAGAGSPAQRA
jgi:hypothetical protein